MQILSVRHVTVYRYRRPVGFGEHRLLLRPRDSADQRLLDFALTIDPVPSELRWTLDAFGNNLAVARFDRRAAELRVESRMRVEHRPMGPPDGLLRDRALSWPFAYASDEVPDLARSAERHHRDPDHAVATWARRFVRSGGPTDTVRMLADMATAIRHDFNYLVRDEKGVQEPHDTLRLNSGTCRDFALLMMEAARSLGLAARFVTGYLHHPRGRSGVQGAGATHAWATIYLPGAGWVEYDPTNAIVGGRDLIRVAMARDPQQAIPLSGGWTGFAGDFLGMTVSVEVSDVSGGDGNADIP